MHPLAGVRAKLARAKEHLDVFDAECRAFLQRHPHGLSDEFYAQPPNDLPGIPGGVEPFAHVGPTFGLLVGDAAHNLRCALDHLAFAVAQLHTPKPCRRTQFPIAVSTKDFAAQATRMLVSVDPVHRALFKQVQPYRRSDLPQLDPLVLLRRISNTDKHRVLLVAMVGVQGPPDLPVGHVERAHGSPPIQAAGPRPGMYMQGDHTVEVAFDQPGSPLDRDLPLAVLWMAHNEIAAEILPRFDPLFR